MTANHDNTKFISLLLHPAVTQTAEGQRLIAARADVRHARDTLVVRGISLHETLVLPEWPFSFGEEQITRLLVAHLNQEKCATERFNERTSAEHLAHPIYDACERCIAETHSAERAFHGVVLDLAGEIVQRHEARILSKMEEARALERCVSMESEASALFAEAKALRAERARQKDAYSNELVVAARLLLARAARDLEVLVNNASKAVAK